MIANTLEAELAAAMALARDPRCAAVVDAFNLRIDAAPWGVGFVEFDGGTYQPSESGDAAFIIAVEEGGERIDLVACRLSDRAMASRRGLAASLGTDAIEAARSTGRKLLLYSDALAWLHAGCHGAVILDWRQAPWLLADVPAITCASLSLTKRLHRALMVPSHLPALSYARAAA